MGKDLRLVRGRANRFGDKCIHNPGGFFASELDIFFHLCAHLGDYSTGDLPFLISFAPQFTHSSRGKYNLTDPPGGGIRNE